MAAIGIMTAQRPMEREVGQIHVYDGITYLLVAIALGRKTK
jgi:hypothetical protein